MDARTIDKIKLADPSAETKKVIGRWRDLVKPGVYRQSIRWSVEQKHHEPRFLRNERSILEEQSFK